MDEAIWEYDDWYQKMADLDLGILEKRVTMSAEAKAELDKVWYNMKISYTELLSANDKDKDVDSARAAWEAASKDMKDAWQRLVPS
jgi:hypothetical protein